MASPPAAYYYAVPTYYVYTPPVYYVPATYYVPVAAPCVAPAAPTEKPEAPAADEPLIPIPAFRAAPGAAANRAAVSSTATGQVRVYSRILDSSGRVVSGAQSAWSGASTDHASLRANGFRLIDSYQTTSPVDPAAKAAQMKRLKAAASNVMAGVMQAEAEKAIANQAAGGPALKTAPPKQDDCAKQIEALTKSIEDLKKQMAAKPAVAPAK